MNIRALAKTLIVLTVSTLSIKGEVTLANVTPKGLIHMVATEEIKIGPLCQKIRALPPGERASLAKRLKQEWIEASAGSATWMKKDFEPYLVAIGDFETIDILIDRFLKIGRDIDALSVSGNPAVITKMGEHLLDDNTMRGGRDNDNPPSPFADGTWKICRSILLAAPEFSSELKAWAEISTESVGTDEPDGPLNEHLSVIRQWWSLNRAAFRAGEFSKVKPGGVLPSWQQAADRKTAQIQRRSIPAPTAETESVTQLPPASTPAVSDPKREPIRNYALYLAVATLLLATVFVFRSRLLRKR